MGQNKSKAPHQPATRGAGFMGLPFTVVESEAFRHLSDRSVRVLLSVLRRFNGYNNGSIVVSYDQICHDLDTTNRSSIGKSMAQLFECGFIEAVAPENRHHHKAREYRIIWISTTSAGRDVQATEEYQYYTPHQEKKTGEAVLPTGVFMVRRSYQAPGYLVRWPY